MTTGVLTLDELMELVAGVRRQRSAQQPPNRSRRHGLAGLGLSEPEFALVVGELERQCYVPLLELALRADNAEELVALVNTQTTSGV